jgi:hypothetical protein
MKNTHALPLCALLVLAFMFGSCTSGHPGNINLSSLGSPGPSPSPSASVSNFQTGWGICCSVLGSGDSIDCGAPKANCFDEVVVSAKAQSSFREFNKAVDEGTTGTFFAGDEWRNIFPNLDKFPEHLEKLRKGLPLLRFEAKTKGLFRYLATRQTRAEILRQASGTEPKPIAGVDFAFSVREER